MSGWNDFDALQDGCCASSARHEDGPFDSTAEQQCARDPTEGHGMPRSTGGGLAAQLASDMFLWRPGGERHEALLSPRQNAISLPWG